MKYLTVVFSVMLLLAIGAQPIFAQSGDDLFQQALQKEHAQGDLDGAISLYQKIVDNLTDARDALVARALLQLGKIYEKLGADLVVEAIRAYERVVREYADHPAIVAEAQSRLAVLVDFADTADTQKALTIRKLLDTEFDGPPSPDGRYFSTTLWDNHGNLGVYDMNSGEYRAITSDGTWYRPIQFAGAISIWSPDGKQIAYSWYKGGEKAVEELRIVNVDGGEPRILDSSSETTGVSYPQAWTSDGKFILVHKQPAVDSGTDRIVLVNVETGSNKDIKALPDGVHTWDMSLSPDGKYIVYETFTLENKTLRNLHIVSTDGRFDQPLIEHPADDHRPFWTPDGNGVVFESDRSGRTGLWYVDVTEGRKTSEPRFVHTASIKTGYGFSNDGTYYYSAERSDINIFIAGIDLDTGILQAQAEVLSKRFEAANMSPSWSPDGSKLAYFSLRGSGNRVLIIRDALSGEERDLRPDGLDIGNLTPRWSPDGKTILVNGRGVGITGVRLFLVDLETDRAQYLSNIDSFKGVLTPDGSGVVFHRVYPDVAGNLGEIVEQNIESGTIRVLEENVRWVSSMAFSPDGSRLAYFDKFDELSPGLVVLSLTDGSRQILIPGSPDRPLSQQAINWTRDGAHLLTALPHEDDGQQQMYLVDVRSGELKPVGSPMPATGTVQSQVSVHPNGTEIAYSSGVRLTQIWAIENLVFEK